jgi:hypothetical protein
MKSPEEEGGLPVTDDEAVVVPGVLTREGVPMVNRLVVLFRVVGAARRKGIA